jgi:phosphoserine phosphatase
MDLAKLLLAEESSSLGPEGRLAAVGRLLDVARALAAEVDVQKVLEVIAREACQAIQCERASLYRYDARRDELYTSVATELEIDEIRKGLDRGICGFVARERVMVNVADPAADPRWNRDVDLITGFHTRNILAAPLTSPRDGALLGVLQLLNNRGGPFDPLDEALMLAFSEHAAVALDRARLVEELQARRALEASLDVAREIQRGFMPERLPDVPGYELASWWLPNQAVGGDYCDVFALRDGRVGLVVADVSGHGLGPSLLMAGARAALRALLLNHVSPENLLSLLGRALAPDLQNGRFITMVLVALDPRGHYIEFANAGHAPAEVYSKAQDRFRILEATGLPLGIEDQPEYPRPPRYPLEIGDVIVLCTDGIIEAMDEHREQFGANRFREVVRTNASASMQTLVETLGARVSRHYVGETPPDDLTILAVRRNA